MNLGDVTKKSVPKMSLVSEPKDGGCISPVPLSHTIATPL